jgi:hypothetical protein
MDIMKREDTDIAATFKELPIQERWRIFVDKLEQLGDIDSALSLAMLTEEELERISSTYPNVALALKMTRYKYKEEVLGHLKEASKSGNVRASIYLLENHFKRREAFLDVDEDVQAEARRMLRGDKD